MFLLIKVRVIRPVGACLILYSYGLRERVGLLSKTFSWIMNCRLALGHHPDTSFSRRDCLESHDEQLLCTFSDHYHLIFWRRGCEDTLARVKGYCVPGVCVGTLQEVVSHFGTQMKVAYECLKGHSGTWKSSPEECQKFTCLLFLLLYSQRSTITELDDFSKLKNQKVISLVTSYDIQKTHFCPAIGICTPCNDSRHWWWVGSSAWRWKVCTVRGLNPKFLENDWFRFKFQLLCLST